MKRAFLIILLFIFTGCMGSSVKPVMSSFEKLDTYNINQIQEKTVGEMMIMTMDARFIPALTAIKEYKIPNVFMLTYPTIQIGYQCLVMGTLESGDYVCALSDRPTVSGGSINWQYCLIIDKDGNPLGDTACSPVYMREWTDKPKNIFRMDKAFQEGSFKQELIYNGKSKDNIKLQYREYKSDLARPAFYQDLIYDLSESKTIGFRGMIVEIIEATNSYIKFIVKSKIN